jgi:hypothetical protein
VSSITVVFKPLYYPDPVNGGYFFSGYHHAFLLYERVVDGQIVRSMREGDRGSTMA